MRSLHPRTGRVDVVDRPARLRRISGSIGCATHVPATAGAESDYAPMNLRITPMLRQRSVREPARRRQRRRAPASTARAAAASCVAGRSPGLPLEHRASSVRTTQLMRTLQYAGSRPTSDTRCWRFVDQPDRRDVIMLQPRPRPGAHRGLDTSRALPSRSAIMSSTSSCRLRTDVLFMPIRALLSARRAVATRSRDTPSLNRSRASSRGR